MRVVQAKPHRLTPWVVAARTLCAPIGWGLLAPGLALAGPTGSEVVGGAVAISAPDATHTVINQTSQDAVVNWQQFNVGSQEYVIFNQPNASAAILNRIIGGDASTILGNITANGRVFLINPNGIIFGQGAKIDVGGLVASTLNIKNEDFMAGHYVFAGDSQASVVNNGTIVAGQKGFVVLAGDSVSNTGVIQAQLGQVVLASGSAMTLDMNGDGLINFKVDQAALSDRAGVANLGDIIAEGGIVVMTAKTAGELTRTTVNNSGLIKAQRISEKGGVIYLAADGGSVDNSGTLDTSGKNGQDGGAVLVHADGNIHHSGTIKVTGKNGGIARLVAEWHLTTELGSLIDGRADDSATGKGGTVELSGHKGISLKGDTLLGQGGTLLLDPDNLTIYGGDSPATTADGSAVYETDIENLLNAGTDVYLIAAKNVGVDGYFYSGGYSYTNMSPGDGSIDATSGSGKLTIGIGSTIVTNAYTQSTDGAFQLGGTPPLSPNPVPFGFTFASAAIGFTRKDPGSATDGNIDLNSYNGAVGINIKGKIDLEGGLNSGEVKTGHINAADITILASKNIEVQGLHAQTGNVSVATNAGGNINVITDTITSAGTVTLQTFGGVSANPSGAYGDIYFDHAIQGGGTVTLTANNDGKILGDSYPGFGPTLTSTNGDVVVNTKGMGHITLGDKVTADGGRVELTTAHGSISTTEIHSGSVDLQVYYGNIDAAGPVTGTTGEVTLETYNGDHTSLTQAYGDIHFSNNVEGYNDVKLIAHGDGTISGDYTNHPTLKSLHGDVTFHAMGLGNIDLYNSGNVTAAADKTLKIQTENGAIGTGLVHLYGGHIIIQSAGTDPVLGSNITLDGVTSDHDISITAVHGGNIIADGALISAGTNATTDTITVIGHGGAIELRNVVTSTGDITVTNNNGGGVKVALNNDLTSTGGNVTLQTYGGDHSGPATPGGDIFFTHAITADKDITIITHDDGDIVGGYSGTASLTSTNGKVTVTAGENGTYGGKIDIDSYTGAAGTITFTAHQANITTGEIDAGGKVTLSAAGHSVGLHNYVISTGGDIEIIGDAWADNALLLKSATGSVSFDGLDLAVYNNADADAALTIEADTNISGKNIRVSSNVGEASVDLTARSGSVNLTDASNELNSDGFPAPIDALYVAGIGNNADGIGASAFIHAGGKVVIGGDLDQTTPLTGTIFIDGQQAAYTQYDVRAYGDALNTSFGKAQFDITSGDRVGLGDISMFGTGGTTLTVHAANNIDAGMVQLQDHIGISSYDNSYNGGDIINQAYGIAHAHLYSDNGNISTGDFTLTGANTLFEAIGNTISIGSYPGTSPGPAGLTLAPTYSDSPASIDILGFGGSGTLFNTNAATARVSIASNAARSSSTGPGIKLNRGLYVTGPSTYVDLVSNTGVESDGAITLISTGYTISGSNWGAYTANSWDFLNTDVLNSYSEAHAPIYDSGDVTWGQAVLRIEGPGTYNEHTATYTHASAGDVVIQDGATGYGGIAVYGIGDARTSIDADSLSISSADAYNGNIYLDANQTYAPNGYAGTVSNGVRNYDNGDTDTVNAKYGRAVFRYRGYKDTVGGDITLNDLGVYGLSAEAEIKGAVHDVTLHNATVQGGLGSVGPQTYSDDHYFYDTDTDNVLTVNGDFNVFTVGFNPNPDHFESATNPITGRFTATGHIDVEGIGSTALALRAAELDLQGNVTVTNLVGGSYSDDSVLTGPQPDPFNKAFVYFDAPMQTAVYNQGLDVTSNGDVVLGGTIVRTRVNIDAGGSISDTIPADALNFTHPLSVDGFNTNLAPDYALPSPSIQVVGSDEYSDETGTYNTATLSINFHNNSTLADLDLDTSGSLGDAGIWINGNGAALGFTKAGATQNWTSGYGGIHIQDANIIGMPATNDGGLTYYSSGGSLVAHATNGGDITVQQSAFPTGLAFDNITLTSDPDTYGYGGAVQIVGSSLIANNALNITGQSFSVANSSTLQGGNLVSIHSNGDITIGASDVTPIYAGALSMVSDTGAINLNGVQTFVGTGTTSTGTDAGLLASINQQTNPNLSPGSASPNAAFVAPLGVDFGELNMAGNYLYVKTRTVFDTIPGDTNIGGSNLDIRGNLMHKVNGVTSTSPLLYNVVPYDSAAEIVLFALPGDTTTPHQINRLAPDYEVTLALGGSSFSGTISVLNALPAWDAPDYPNRELTAFGIGLPNTDPPFNTLTLTSGSVTGLSNITIPGQVVVLVPFIVAKPMITAGTVVGSLPDDPPPVQKDDKPKDYVQDPDVNYDEDNSHQTVTIKTSKPDSGKSCS